MANQFSIPDMHRRNFLTSSASGLGLTALAALLERDCRADERSGNVPIVNPLAVKKPHFAPKAKNCIFFFQAGAPSQLDLFDPSPSSMNCMANRCRKRCSKKFASRSSRRNRPRSSARRASGPSTVNAGWTFLTSCRTWQPVPTIC